ncbi:Myc-type, basic helix-loop-helix domain-containing protein [Radiomyces spectabilis]|uniref:Myc-type, basic helix-loop-helix domain-containing protein n=1 Tax=Radiomyces spectabilis TaxID=64574 RepID=UPI002220061B|nr:Myc-type, basic helix-loop-helix domain-containing protein [Radiomyces spectabilis]KAI8369447.1 Myc-type, basic helix-loop-helix domain-containing protein [Radiomyces spectabilis]
MYNMQFHPPGFQSPSQPIAEINNVLDDPGNNNFDTSSGTIAERRQLQQSKQYNMEAFQSTPKPTYKVSQVSSPQQPSSVTSFHPRSSMYQEDAWRLATKQPTNETYAVKTDSAGTPANTSASNLDDDMQQRHMQQLFEKKRRRRESHNAVERRRRDNINERIYELSTLLPERDASKNNKGTILKKSVDHIRMLHEEVHQYQQRIQELEGILEMHRVRMGNLSYPILDVSSIQPSLGNFNHTTSTYRRR